VRGSYPEGARTARADDAKLQHELSDARKRLQRTEGHEHQKGQRELLDKGQRDLEPMGVGR
jgi:hypothetical protein